MGKVEDLVQYECDRCGGKEITAKGSYATTFWHDIERTSADGVTVRRLLCDSCYKEYTAFVAGEDSAFNAFMEGKE